MVPERILTGIPASPGIAIGELFVYRHDDPEIPRFALDPSRIDREVDRFDHTVEISRMQLLNMYHRLIKQIGEGAASIFKAQATLLDDVQFTGEIRDAVRRDMTNAEAVVNDTSQRWQKAISSLDGELFRQKSHDIHDVSLRLIKNLLGAADHSIGPLDRPAILVSDDLMPSDVAHLVHKNVLAVATDLGSETSHTVILTRSLEVPAVVGLLELSIQVKNGDRIIIDGNNGKVIVNPSENTIRIYVAKQMQYQHYTAGFADIHKLPAVTKDNRRIALRANIELPHEVDSVLNSGAEGVGLYRSEYLFLLHGRIPDEQEQYDNYRQAIEAAAPNPVTIRTFDLGGDKVFGEFPLPAESNPFLGWRAIRVCLDQPELLRTQLRAIVRASRAGPTKIMFPFISGVGEIRQVKVHLAEVKKELAAEKVKFGEITVGVMIELPSAVLVADSLAAEVDFFSIGTNDLTQFTLAVDRNNQQVKDRYQPLHPALIRLIKMTVDAGHKAGIEVGVCGEIAANPLATLLLVGLHLDELSVSPVALPQIKQIIRSISYSEAVNFAEKALTIDTAEELLVFCEKEAKARFAELPIWNNGNGTV